MQTSGTLSKIKRSIVPSGKKVRKVKSGILSGIRLPIDLHVEFQIYIGTWERETYGWIRRLTEGVNTFIDIGASTGPITLFGMCKTEATQVIAIEPQISLHDELRQSLRLNDVGNGDRIEIRSFLVGKGNSEEVKPLDTLYTKVESPCFIKCDVDGPEAEVLRSGKKIMDKKDVRFLVETHSREAEKQCTRILDKSGYCTQVVKNAWWRAIVPEQRPIKHNRWLVAWKR